MFGHFIKPQKSVNNTVMRKSLYIPQVRSFLIILLGFFLVTCDNTDISSDQADSFIKLFGLWRFDEGRDVKQVDDGYIIVGTTTVTLDSLKDIVIIKTNKFGNKVWDKTFGGKGDDAGNKLLITDDGYILVGTITDDTNEKDMYIVKVNKQGEKQWDKQIGGVFDETGNSIVSVADGYIICGSTTEPSKANPAGKSDILLVKINTSGDVVWTNSWGSEGDEIGNDLLVTTSGYIIIGTTNSFSEPGQAGNNIILIKTNGEGGETDKMTYGGAFSDLGHSIIHAIGGGYIIVGSKGKSAANSKVYMAKVQENINIIDFEVELGAETDYGFGYDVVEHWGNYAIVGNKTLSEKNAVYFFETDPNGTVIMEKYFGGYDDQVMFSVDNTSEGGYIMVGKSGQGTNYMICLMKLNSKGAL
jgi:hypothetical protein